MSRYVYFQVTDTTGAGVTGDAANLTMRVVKDGVSSAATNTPSEVDAINLPGWYSLLLTDAELNANSILVSGSSSTSGAIVDAVAILDQQVDATNSVLDVFSTLKTNVDATISSRLAAASYTAPDNASISAIKTQTDKLVFNGSNHVAADVLSISGDTIAANNLEADYDGTGYNKSASTIGTVTNVTNGVTVTTNNDKTGYTLSAAGVDAIWDEPQSGHITAGTFGKYLDTEVSGATGADVGAIAAAVWDEARAGHTTAGTFGEGVASVQGNVTGNVNGTVNDVVSTVDANVTQVGGSTTAVTNMKADYDGTGYNKSASTIGTVTNVTNPVTAGSITDKTGYELSAAGIDAIWDEVMETLGTGNQTARQIMKLCLAVLGGLSSGGGTSTVTFKRGDGTTNAVTATVDSNGNRTAVTLNI